MDDGIWGAAGTMVCGWSLSAGRFDSTLFLFMFGAFGAPITPAARRLSYFRLVSHTHLQRWQDHAVAIPCSALGAELIAFAWRKSWTDRPNYSNHGVPRKFALLLAVKRA